MESRNQSLAVQNSYPWTIQPLIVAAPMRLISGPALAVAVSRAGGLGFIGSGVDVGSLELKLDETAALLAKDLIPNTSTGILPIGVGFINWGADLEIAIHPLSRHVPAAVWLFAPRETNDLKIWTERIRDATKGRTKVWVQVGSVATALEVAKLCKPDVLVIQGTDAGGHGYAKGASLISLLPECADVLAAAGLAAIPLVAAGGIMEGRGVAAALALGATGVCMGTRFLASDEAEITDGNKQAVLDAVDGGQNTVRTKLYDALRGTRGWPENYNGRAIVNRSFLDAENGNLALEENKRLYALALTMGELGWGREGRITTYAGTGVGLVNAVLPAGRIVENVRREFEVVMGRMSSRL